MTPAKASQDQPQVTPQKLAGQTIRMMREAHSVGLREMAEKVGISPSHLSRVESGERAAGGDLTARICDVIAGLQAPQKATS